MEYGSFFNEEHKEVLRLITKNEEKLQETFSDEQRELFSKYADCVQEFQTISECLLFGNSFRLGAKMMLESHERILISYKRLDIAAKEAVSGLYLYTDKSASRIY